MNIIRWDWLPNGLTVSRFVAGLILPFVDSRWQFFVVLLAGFTDLIDGELGRRLGGTSHFGRIMDPIADKTLVISAALCTVWSGWLTVTALVFFAARDIAVVVLSVVAMGLRADNWKNLQPRLTGKMATGGQVLTLLLMFASRSRWPVLTWIVAGISVLSAIDYTASALRTWHRIR